jgi:hypothetical protein
MFSENDIKIRIDPEFPADKLKTLMEPCLKLYYISKYSTNKWKKMNAQVKLYSRLNKIKEMPSFGRLKCKLQHKSKFSKINKPYSEIKEFMFDEKLPEFISLYDFEIISK